jgi:hypothetical protein
MSTSIFSADGLEGGAIFGLRGGESSEASEQALLVLRPGAKGGAVLGLEGALSGLKGTSIFSADGLEGGTAFGL